MKVADAWCGLPDEIHAVDRSYSKRVTNVLEEIVTNVRTSAAGAAPLSLDDLQAKGFWKDILTGKICGSGHQIEVDGWFSKLYRKQPKGMRQAQNFASHLAKVDYKLLDTGQTFTMLSGVLSSHEDENGALWPAFERVVYETTPREPATLTSEPNLPSV